MREGWHLKGERFVPEDDRESLSVVGGRDREQPVEFDGVTCKILQVYLKRPGKSIAV